MYFVAGRMGSAMGASEDAEGKRRYMSLLEMSLRGGDEIFPAGPPDIKRGPH